jgi:hypothetical protein
MAAAQRVCAAARRRLQATARPRARVQGWCLTLARTRVSAWQKACCAVSLAGGESTRESACLDRGAGCAQAQSLYRPQGETGRGGSADVEGGARRGAVCRHCRGQMFARVDDLADLDLDALVARFVEVLKLTEHGEKVVPDVVVCTHLLRKVHLKMKL